jgi:hypothetical protein
MHDTFSSLVAGTVYTVSYQAKRLTSFIGFKLSVDGNVVQTVDRGFDANWVVRTFTFTAASTTALFTFQELVFNVDANSIPNAVVSLTYLDDFKISSPGCNTSP